MKLLKDEHFMDQSPPYASDEAFVKPRKISIKDGNCIFHALLKRWVIKRSEVSRIEAGPTTSLVDEIYLIIGTHHNRFFVPETLDGFGDLIRWLGIDDVLGSDWYRRAEAGEHLVG